MRWFELIFLLVVGSIFFSLGWKIWKKKKISLIHDYIHSFRFAQAQNVMKMFFLSLFFFIILLVGNSVYYKSRGGEWAVRLSG